MITKQAIPINFAKGLDTKTDPKQVEIGSFLSLENSIFNKGGLLQKRNGYKQITSLPDTTYSYVTTLNDNLTAIGKNIAAYNSANSSWVQKGHIQPLKLSTLPLIRNNLNQTTVDAATARNGLVCTVYIENNAGTLTNKYAIADSVTGQNIIAPTTIPVASGTVSGGMRVFVLGTYFVIVFTNTITAVTHLQYITISTSNPTSVGSNTDIAASYVASTTLSWDGFVAGERLYLAYNTTSGGQAVKVTYLTNFLSQPTPTSFSAFIATLMSVTADITNPASPIIYVSFYDSGTSKGYTAALDQNLNLIMNPFLTWNTQVLVNLTSAAQNGAVTVFGEVTNTYSGSSGLPSNFIDYITITPLQMTFKSTFSVGAGTITASSATGLVNGMYLIDNSTSSHITDFTSFTVSGTTLTLSHNTAGNSAGSPGDTLTALTLNGTGVSIRSVGLASKAFIVDGVIYYLGVYSSTYQPTYFLINGSVSTSASPVVTAKLAYGNGGGYLLKGLPGVTLSGTTAKIPYLFKDLIEAVNKGTALASGTQTAGIYSQTGINYATFTIGTTGLDTAEIGGDLHLSGGFLWMYDGYLPVEHNFFLWPDLNQGTSTDAAVWSATGGSMVAKPDGVTSTNAYYYQYTYEWTDNVGNAFRSAPSIPLAVTTTGSGTAGSVVLTIPTLRLTYKVSNPVKIVIYRWSVGQQIYYQTTSLTSPLLNDTTADSVSFTDINSDATILGNNIIYTNGGVVEDVNAPASNLMTLFDTRLWLVDAEDPNLLWFSKQVIESTPVEMSDLFTMYIAPTTAAQGSTGPMTAISVMDDKLIIFKQNAAYYVNGSGPDNTGANNQYSQPIFITSTVGCANQQSIVFTPQGLMFQSDKGIWILDRGMGTAYIGAPVEEFTLNATVESAQNIPETNQVRFILDSGVTLMYDYYYGQWSTFTNVSAISSCIYQGFHTFINSLGAVYQENPGSYLDGSNPVLMSFLTGPIRLGSLQNYQRAYSFFLLGSFLSPHKINVTVAYDYANDPSQSTLISPANYSSPYGSGTSQSLYGTQSLYGGPNSLEEFRVFLQHQRCKAINIGFEEIYDPSVGGSAGAGLTLSGINVICGFKNVFTTIAASNTYG